MKTQKKKVVKSQAQKILDKSKEAKKQTTQKQTIKQTVVQKKTIKAFKDIENKSNVGFIIWHDDTLQDILKKSGKNTQGNEFQVHYWALNLRFKAVDGSLLDICIPTCVYNYEHTVSSATIDFELKDVIAVSNKTEPLHNMKVNELMKSNIVQELEEMFDVSFDAMSTFTHSLHRHPGSKSHQSFSGTDYRNDITYLGVVFPIEKASNDLPNFAGIMTIDNKQLSIAHYEYRIVNGDLGKDLVYQEGTTVCIVIKDTVFPSVVASMFGAKAVNDSYIVNESKDLSFSNFLQPIVESSLKDFKPSTDAVLAENLKVKEYKYGHSFPKNKTSYGHTKQPSLYDMYDYTTFGYDTQEAYIQPDFVLAPDEIIQQAKDILKIAKTEEDKKEIQFNIESYEEGVKLNKQIARAREIRSIRSLQDAVKDAFKYVFDFNKTLYEISCEYPSVEICLQELDDLEEEIDASVLECYTELQEYIFFYTEDTELYKEKGSVEKDVEQFATLSQKELSARSDTLQVMCEHLESYGIARTTLITKSYDEISDMYEKLSSKPA